MYIKLSSPRGLMSCGCQEGVVSDYIDVSLIARHVTNSIIIIIFKEIENDSEFSLKPLT